MESYGSYGYEDSRFENAVSENFHCPICLNVFKDPVMCQRNQHCFCRPCITRHLTNSKSCPSCMEELTLETLTRAPRIVRSCLSELKIRCEFYNRGCRECVHLEDLETHMKDCGFTPVLCSNEGCLAEFNKRDQTHHETETCEFRKAKWHNCSDMGAVKTDLMTVTEKAEEMITNLTAVTEQVAEVNANLKVTMEKVDELKVNFTEVTKEMEEIKNELSSIKGSFAQLTTLPDQLCRIQTTQTEIMKEIERTKPDETSRNINVVIAGGYGTQALNSVEMFRWPEKSWSPLQPMTKSRHAASSFVFKNQIMVAGGVSRSGPSNKMERIDIRPVMGRQRWSNCPARLPVKLHGYTSSVYNERLITTGGYDSDERVYTDSIHELLLTPPYTPNVLSRMPEPVAFHGAQLFNDKIIIMGGRKKLTSDSSDHVLTYDIAKNECTKMSPLPFAVSEMATVRWRDSVIVLGGADKNDQALSTVVIYNVETGKCHMLPEMKCKRKACTAVVSQNTVVVMGGRDEQRKILNSAEYFSFDCYSWTDLPPLNEPRAWATAVAW